MKRREGPPPEAEPALRTRILNRVRDLFRLPVLEALVARLSRGRRPGSLLGRLPPNHYQYPRGSVRRVRRDGVRFELDPSDFVEWYVFYGLRIPPRERFFEALRPGDTVVDAGANVGEVALRAAKRVGPEGRVVAAEPHPGLAGKLRRNLELNPGIRNVTVVEAALGVSAGRAVLSTPDARNAGMYRLDGGEGEGGVDVPVERLDELVDRTGIAAVDVLKADVEGSEMDVLEGGRKTISRHRPRLFVEVVDENLRARGSSAAELVGWLEERGYRVTDAEEGRVVRPDDAAARTQWDLWAEPRERGR